MMTLAYIGIGSNIGDRKENCINAIGLMNKCKDVRVVKTSRWYESEAVPVAGGYTGNQPAYVNGVCELETSLDPHSLFAVLSAIEHKMGRPHMRLKGQPRAIDLDLLLYGDQIINDKDLTVPHPELCKRLFVLQPLCDIAPDIVETKTKERISALLAKIKTEELVICSD